MSETQAKAGRSVGIELGKSEMIAVCIEADGRVVGSQAALVSASEPSSKQIVEFASGLHATFGRFERLGLALPGLIDRESRRVSFSAHFPEHSEADLISEIEQASKLRVTVENDANAAAYGEYRLGAGRGAENIFYVTLGIGVGGCFIFGGKIWHGVRGFAGEFGYVPINSEGTRLEDVASSANLIRRTRNRFSQDSTSSLVEIDERNIKTSDIVSAAAADDDFAKLMLERTGTYVGTAIATVINLTNIERIIVGGEIARGQNVVIDAIVARARELSFAPSFASTTILEGELGQNAAASGVALLALDE